MNRFELVHFLADQRERAMRFERAKDPLPLSVEDQKEIAEEGSVKYSYDNSESFHIHVSVGEPTGFPE